MAISVEALSLELSSVGLGAEWVVLFNLAIFDVLNIPLLKVLSFSLPLSSGTSWKWHRLIFAG